MPNAAKPAHYEPLEYVVTAASAARLYGVYRSTITYAIDAGNVAAVKCGGVWLVSVPSLVAWFGPIPENCTKAS